VVLGLAGLEGGWLMAGLFRAQGGARGGKYWLRSWEGSAGECDLGLGQSSVILLHR